jgi:hypothetical protein
MQHGFISMNDKEFDMLINAIYPPGNYNMADNAASDLVMMTLKAIQNGKHPVMNRRKFLTDVLPVPNMTVFNKKTERYTGVRFPANCSLALDLFSVVNNIDSRSFVTMEELKRMKLDSLVRNEDQINIVLKKHWIKDNVSSNNNPHDLMSLRVINTESLLKTSKNSHRGLNRKDFDMYFPDFDKQIPNYLSFTEKFVKLLQQSTRNKDYNNIKQQIAMDTNNSHLPELTAGLVRYEFSRIIKSEYIPHFSREDHQKTMIKLFRQNPELLKDAIMQSGHIVAKSIDRLFSNGISVNNSVKLQHSERTKENTRKLSLSMA